MAEGQINVLKNLIIIGEIDSKLAHVLAERNKLDTEIKTKKAELLKLEKDSQSADRVLNEKKEHYRKEEKKLKEERDKLVDRRKALTTLNNYKLQQAAEREIDHSSSQLNLHEEGLLGILGQLDTLEDDAKKKTALFATAKKGFEELEKDAVDTFVSLEERQKRHSEEREKLLHLIDKNSTERLRTY